MAASSVLAVLAMAELIPALDTVLELLRNPLGAVLFVPLYALWVTLLLPGVWASMLAGVLYGTWGSSALVFRGPAWVRWPRFCWAAIGCGIGPASGWPLAAAGD